MIVRRTGRVLHLITQPDHAALSRRVMERWVPLHDAPRRASILLAIEEHDNGWREPDAAPMVDAATGRIYDFITVPTPIRQAVWPRGVARVAEADLWAGALVAQHALTIYDRYQTDPAWGGFFAAMTERRDALLRLAGRSAADLQHDYAFVRIGDLISLVFCNQWTEAQRYDQWSIGLTGDCVAVAPDAFGGRRIPIAIRAREIPDVPYASDDQVQQALRAAPAVTLHGLISGAP
jgi:hypothetical protein